MGKRGRGDLFEGGGLQFLHKKLKSEIFNDKKVDKQKCFSLKNSNWEILTNNLVTSER